MGQVGGAFVRLRPALAPEDADALAELAGQFRELADGLDDFRERFMVDADAKGRPAGTVPLRLAVEVKAELPIRVITDQEGHAA